MKLNLCWVKAEIFMYAGERDLQLWPGWFDDWRYLHPGLSLWYFCLGGATGQLQI